MSKHIGRKQRWTQESSTRYASELGTVIYRERAWYALLDYKTLAHDENQLPVWTAQNMQLGPFKRPRNAMVALEREVTALQNRQGKNVLIGHEIWAEK
ncbi:hypothetical protein AYO44_10360 [Planctomycetaceae bacterium SCGC AG-212-F19]|nr:hypothetical protein AYO44_10360 [Planctomycetaceae bacterium SCGC AG-212-F19]